MGVDETRHASSSSGERTTVLEHEDEEVEVAMDEELMHTDDDIDALFE